MSENEAVIFYTSTLAAIARGEQIPPLTMIEARVLLHGALVIGGEHDAVEPLRDAYTRLCDCDAQLKLIAIVGDQLQLNLRES